MIDKILSLDDVKEMTTLSRSSIYNAMEGKLFPRCVKLMGARAMGWRLSDIQKYIKDLPYYEKESLQVEI